MQEHQSSLTFEEIYQAFGKKILNLAYKMTANEEVARDLTQDVFMKVYQNLATFREQSQVYTWIYRIAVNHILSHLKKQRRYQWFDLMDKSIAEVLHEERIDPTFWARSNPTPSDGLLEKSEREKIVWSSLQALALKYRVPLVLYHYEGMSYQEIADYMKLSLSAVEARIHRAKKQLIVKLEPWLKHI